MNNFAISSGGIGEALKRSASSLNAANNTIDESIALITASNEVVQDPDRVGNALKTVSMRIRGAKTEMEEAGLETDGMVESVAKLQAEIKALSGVDIMLDKDNFKSTYQIMDELSAKWEDLSDIAQATIIELIAGKHQGNVIASLMENFNTARDALDTSINSSGSAMAEHAKWSESLEARLLKLQAAWQSLAQSFLNSDFLKVVLDIATALADILDKLIKQFGSFGTIGLGVGLFSIFKNGAFTGILKGLREFGSLAIGGIRGSKSLAEGFKNIGVAAAQAGGDIVSGFSSKLSLVTAGIGLAVAAFGLISNAIKNHFEELSRVRQETIETSDAFLKSANTFEQAYIKYSGRTDLTAEEEQELESAINGTVDALGDKSSALQDVVDSSNDYIASLEKIAEAELKEANNAAQKKKIAAEGELKNAAIGWSEIEGSEIDVSLPTSNEEVQKIAEEIGGKYYQLFHSSRNSNQMGFVLKGNASTEEILEYYYKLKEFQSELIDMDLGESKDYENVEKAISKMTEAVEAYTSGVYDAAKAEYQLKNGIPKTVDEYLKMRESILDEIGGTVETRKTIAGSLDSEYGGIFDLTSAEVQAKKLIGVLDSYGDKEASQMEIFLNMRTAVNNGECTVGEYLSKFNEINAMTEGWSDAEKKEFESSFSLDTDTIKKQYEDAYKYISRNYLDKLDTTGMRVFEAREYKKTETKRIQDLLKSLTASELEAVVKLEAEIDWENTNTDKILEQIRKEAEFIEAMRFTITMSTEIEGVEALNSAMAESVSATGLTSESIDALKSRYAELEDKGYDLSVMFEETANGIHLNKDAISEFEQKLASDRLSETEGHLEVLKSRYDELTTEINNCRDASERASLYREQQDILQRINDLGTLASQLDGLTSAYNAWQNAESAGSERDMYESVLQGFETVGDEIKRGWVDDGTIKFLELLRGEKATIIDGNGVKKEINIATASAKELKQVYEDLDDTIKHTNYSVTDFFTKDEDGNSTSKGVYNFLDAVGQLEEEAFSGKDVVKRDDDGNIIGFDFNLVGGDEAIAEALGISEELVQIMLRAADDAGFVVTLDGNWTQFADLKNQAEEANDSLKKIAQTNKSLKEAGFGSYEFDFDTDNIETLDKELGKAKELLSNDAFKGKDGKFNINAKGAKDALKIAETLQIAKSRLEEPAYMSIDTTELQEELQEPVKQLQEFEKLTQERDLLNLTGTDKERLSEIDTELDNIATKLSKLPDETKIDLGIEGMTPEQIREELENGTIEVPAELTIEANMDKNLEDLVTLGLLEQGLITEAEAKIKLGIDDSGLKGEVNKAVDNASDNAKAIKLNLFVKDSFVDDKYTDKEQEVIVKFIADPSDVENYSPEDKEAIIKFIVDSLDIDGYTPEEKKAYAKYLVDGGDINAYTPEEKTAIAKYLADTGEPDDYTPEEKTAIAKFLKNSAEVDSYSPEDKQAIAKFLKNSLEPDNYIPPNKEAIAKFVKDSIEPDNYEPSDKDATVTYNKDSSKVDNYDPPNIFRKVIYTASQMGESAAKKRTGSDLSPADGTAFARGSWGINGSGTALVGEQGQELVVRNGRYFTVGDYGAEFFKYEPNDIVFNAGQTKQLFEQGKIVNGRTRGRTLASGTAFAEGTALSKGTGGGIMPEVESTTVTTTTTKTNNSGSSNSSSNKSSTKTSTKSKSDSSDTEKEFEETIDWIQTAIDRLERAIDKLDLKASSVYKTWSERNSNLTKEIGKVGDEIELQEKAAKKYLKEANSVGLSESWAKKVREGKVDIEIIKDEGLKEKIDDYQKWYEKYLACIDAAEQLREEEAKLYAQRFENTQAEYDGILQGYEHTESMLNEYISQAEAKGHIVSKGYYNALIDNEKKSIAELEKEQADLIAKRDEAVDSGAIAKNSEEWHKMCQEIDSVTQEIEAGTTALIEYNNAMRDIDWSIFDLIQERISNITEEADFLIELMSNDKLFDDKGKLTNQGMATMGLHAQNYNTNMYQADELGSEIASLNEQIAKDPYNQDLINRRNDLLAQQREFILAAEDEKNAIRDMVEEGINLELEALQELIDKKNEELQSEKDLYDYQKKVKSQVSEIASLRKQLSSYDDDDSEETKAKVQQLKMELSAAEDELAESEYEKLIQDSEILLSSLYDEYSLILNTRLDNLDYLLEQMIAEVNNSASGIGSTLVSELGLATTNITESLNAGNATNTTTIKTTLETEANKVGVTLSSAMKGIWNVGEGNAKSVLTMYGEDFRNKSTTTNTVLNGIKVGVDKMVASLNKDAQKKTTANKTTTSAKKNPATSTSKKTNTSTNKTTTKKTTTSGDGKPKVGDKVKFVSGKYYYDSQGKKPLGSHYQGKEVYITNINEKSWATHPYHISTGKKLGSGDLGWLKLNQISGYATGKKNFLNDEIAWTQEDGREFIVRPSDGAILTPVTKRDSILNANASSNIWDMANSPADFIKENLNLGSADIPNNSNASNSYVQNLDKVVFNLPNVKNYEELLVAMQKDRNFEKLIHAMTVDRLAGKSSLAKGKSIR